MYALKKIIMHNEKDGVCLDNNALPDYRTDSVSFLSRPCGKSSS